MLDKLGLTKKDGEGYRLRADGGGRLRLAITTYRRRSCRSRRSPR